MKREKRDKKTPMFESAFPTNYDFVDYTGAEKLAAQQAHKEGIFGNQDTRQMEGSGQTKIKSIFDQIVETKEHEVEISDSSANRSQQSFNFAQQQSSSWQAQKSNTTTSNPRP